MLLILRRCRGWFTHIKNCNAVSRELAGVEDEILTLQADIQLKSRAHGQFWNSSTQTWGNVLSPWLHYPAPLTYVSQPFSTWRLLRPNTEPQWLMIIWKSAWGWLPAATLPTTQPWLIPCSASHQSKVMTKNVQSGIVPYGFMQLFKVHQHILYIWSVLSIYINKYINICLAFLM